MAKVVETAKHSEGIGDNMSFEDYLTSNKVNLETCKVLKSNGFESLHELEQLSIDDLNDLCKEFGIGFSQKAKLKFAIRQLPNNLLQSNTNNKTVLVHIDKEESNAVKIYNK